MFHDPVVLLGLVVIFALNTKCFYCMCSRLGTVVGRDRWASSLGMGTLWSWLHVKAFEVSGLFDDSLAETSGTSETPMLPAPPPLIQRLPPPTHMALFY